MRCSFYTVGKMFRAYYEHSFTKLSIYISYNKFRIKILLIYVQNTLLYGNLLNEMRNSFLNMFTVMFEFPSLNSISQDPPNAFSMICFNFHTKNFYQKSIFLGIQTEFLVKLILN